LKYIYDIRSQNKKSFTITKTLAIASIAALLSIVPGAVMLSNKTAHAAKPIKIGASLKTYNKPSRKDCDVKVPSQYQTIQEGVDAASPGNKVCIAPGSYNENVAIGKSIQLSGSGSSNTIINGQTSDSTVYVAGDARADNTIIEGFLINGTDGTGLNDPATVNIGPYASGIILRHNYVASGNAQLAVRMDSLQTNGLAYNNVFMGNNSPDLFLVGGGNVDFLNNTFQGTVDQTNSNNGSVIETWATDSTIQYNIFNTTGSTGSLIGSAYATNNLVTNNNFNSAVTLKVGTYSGGVLNAENNWWGDLDPSDNIWGDIDYTPLATTPFAEY
jgi:hypothetical protein